MDRRDHAPRTSLRTLESPLSTQPILDYRVQDEDHASPNTVASSEASQPPSRPESLTSPHAVVSLNGTSLAVTSQPMLQPASSSSSSMNVLGTDDADVGQGDAQKGAQRGDGGGGGGAAADSGVTEEDVEERTRHARVRKGKKKKRKSAYLSLHVDGRRRSPTTGMRRRERTRRPRHLRRHLSESDLGGDLRSSVSMEVLPSPSTLRWQSRRHTVGSLPRSAGAQVRHLESPALSSPPVDVLSYISAAARELQPRAKDPLGLSGAPDTPDMDRPATVGATAFDLASDVRPTPGVKAIRSGAAGKFPLPLPPTITTRVESRKQQAAASGEHAAPHISPHISPRPSPGKVELAKRAGGTMQPESSLFERPGRTSRQDLIRQQREKKWVEQRRAAMRSMCLLPIVHPASPHRRNWDIVVVVLLIYNLIEIPFRLCFEVDPEPWSFEDNFNLLVDMLFMTDVLVQFHTGFHDSGYYVTNPHRIAARYLRGWFAFDVFTSIPYSHIIQLASSRTSTNSTARLPRLLRILRVARLYKVLRLVKLWRVLDGLKRHRLSTSVRTTLVMGKFFLICFLLSHSLACIWMLIAMAHRDEDGEFSEESWIRRWGAHSGKLYLQPEDIRLATRYLVSLYWAITTLTTVGYGEIHPQMDAEISFAVCVELIGAIMMGTIIAHLSRVVQLKSHQDEVLSRKKKSIRSYLDFHNFEPDLAQRIMAHYQFVWARSTVFHEREIMDELPGHLRTEVALFLNADLIDSVPFLKSLGDECVSMLVTKLRPLQIAPNSFVFKANSLGREMFFVSKGVMEVLDAEGNLLCALERGAYFGEYAILADRPTLRTASIRAATFVDLYSLSKEDFDEVLRLYPNIHMDMVERAKEQWRSVMEPLLSDNNARSRAAAANTAAGTVHGSASAPSVVSASAAAANDGESDDKEYNFGPFSDDRASSDDEGESGDDEEDEEDAYVDLPSMTRSEITPQRVRSVMNVPVDTPSAAAIRQYRAERAMKHNRRSISEGTVEAIAATNNDIVRDSHTFRFAVDNDDGAEDDEDCEMRTRTNMRVVQSTSSMSLMSPTPDMRSVTPMSDHSAVFWDRLESMVAEPIASIGLRLSSLERVMSGLHRRLDVLEELGKVE